MAWFGTRPPRPEAEARRRVEGWVRAVGGVAADTVVKANEIVCPDPACPGFETVILILVPGRPGFARRIAKPLAEVTEVDVAEALGPNP